MLLEKRYRAKSFDLVVIRLKLGLIILWIPNCLLKIFYKLQRMSIHPFKSRMYDFVKILKYRKLRTRLIVLREEIQRFKKE